MHLARLDASARARVFAGAPGVAPVARPGRVRRRRRLDDHRQRHPVGADVDLHVLVGGAETHLRLDERAARRDPERGLEIDDVGHLGELRELGADLERDLGQPVHHELGQPVHGLGDHRQPQEPPHRGRRDAPVDGPRPALLCVDVPAGAPLEPGPAVRREPPRVALPLKRRAHDDLRAVGGQLEVEPRTQRLVAEAELHHLRLDDHAPPLQERQQIARVFAADVDSDAAGPLVLEAREQPDRVAIRGRVLVLRDEQRARQQRHPVLGIEQRDGQPAPRAAGVADGFT